MRVALYARVSTSDRDQDPETQLLVLRDYARAQGFDVAREYVDRAPANDLRGRTAWRRLLDDGAKRRFAACLVFKLDRAFRSVKHMHDTLAVWEVQGVGFLSAREGFDTRTALGRLLLNLLASLAEFELEVLRERVKAGMDRARRQGKHVGRPGGTAAEGFAERCADVLPSVRAGQMPVAAAAAVLGVSRSTVRRLLTNLGDDAGQSAQHGQASLTDQEVARLDGYRVQVIEEGRLLTTEETADLSGLLAKLQQDQPNNPEVWQVALLGRFLTALAAKPA